MLKEFLKPFLIFILMMSALVSHACKKDLLCVRLEKYTIKTNEHLIVFGQKPNNSNIVIMIKGEDKNLNLKHKVQKVIWLYQDEDNLSLPSPYLTISSNPLNKFMHEYYSFQSKIGKDGVSNAIRNTLYHLPPYEIDAIVKKASSDYNIKDIILESTSDLYIYNLAEVYKFIPGTYSVEVIAFNEKREPIEYVNTSFTVEGSWIVNTLKFLSENNRQIYFIISVLIAVILAVLSHQLKNTAGKIFSTIQKRRQRKKGSK